MKLKKIFTVTACMALSVSVFAGGGGDKKDAHHGDHHAPVISYDFLDFAYMDAEAHSEDGSGTLFRVSKGFSNNVYLIGEMGVADLTHDLDFSFARVGVGYHYPLSPKVDVVGEVTYEDLDLSGYYLDKKGEQLDKEGYGLGVGIRALFSPSFEGTAKVRRIDFGKKEDTLKTIELLYLFNHNFGLVGAYEEASDEKIASFGIRFQW